MGLLGSCKANLLSAFVRPYENIAYIDGLRALSCLGIMLYHSFFLLHLFVPEATFTRFVDETPLYLSWIWGLDKTVDVFFVISGFLIGRMLFREQQKKQTLDLKAFYWRRYLRLTPVYLFAIGVFYLLAGPEYSQTLWANVLYLNNFLPLESMSMPWTWTLAVEEQFYILLPLLLTLIILPSRHALELLLGLFALSFVIIGLVAFNDPLLWQQSYYDIFTGKDNIIHYFDTLYVNLHTRFGTLISGVILAYLTVHKAQWIQHLLSRSRLTAGLTVLSVLIITIGIMINGNKHWLGESVELARLNLILDRNLFGMAICWIILMCSAPGWMGKVLQRFFSARIWYPFAQLSYSMYLFHYMLAIPLVLITVNLLKQHYGTDVQFQHHWFLLVFVGLAMTTAPLSLITYTLIERPFINMRRPAAASAGDMAKLPAAA